MTGPPTGFFAIDKNGYIATQIVLFLFASFMAVAPANWISAAEVQTLIGQIKGHWPKMLSDAERIATASPVLADRYVLASAAGAVISTISTAVLAVVLIQKGPTGNLPYYVKRQNLILAPLVFSLSVYFWCFATSHVPTVFTPYSRNAKELFLSPIGLFLSACGLGLVGTIFVRATALYWLWFSDRRRIPA